MPIGCAGRHLMEGTQPLSPVIIAVHPYPCTLCLTEQEGQHPLTGQRAANFRLLANQ